MHVCLFLCPRARPALINYHDSVSVILGDSPSVWTQACAKLADMMNVVCESVGLRSGYAATAMEEMAETARISVSEAQQELEVTN